tara:strand:- start:18697 stop:19341 length:645 start_codon:yes stop_codon:yes gene_type:complete
MAITPENNPEIYRGITEERKQAETLAPAPPFFLIFNPGEWELGEVGGSATWLPTLALLWEVPGVNNVRGTRNGADSSMARVKLEEQGRTVLPQSLGYVKRLPARGGAWHYCLTWDHTRKIGNKTLTRHDSEGYNRWRLELMESGTIPRPDPDVLEIAIERLSDRVRRHAARANIPGVKAKLDRDQARLDSAQRAIEELRSPPPPPSSKKKKVPA